MGIAAPVLPSVLAAAERQQPSSWQSRMKANFGTMTFGAAKPSFVKANFAGQAAERGLLAARLASRGYTADRNAVDGSQGLAQAAGSGGLEFDRIEQWGDRWATTQALFKHHAACHCTHAGLEATRSLLTNGINAHEIERITLTVNPSILDMCGIPEPVTGLEAKFSLRGTQALAGGRRRYLCGGRPSTTAPSTVQKFKRCCRGL